MKKYELSITKGNCADWTVENAIREILQNAYDAEEDSNVDYDNGTLTVTTYNTSLPAKMLLLGCSTKRYDDDTVGGKGEGFKVGCGILLREGLELTILNGPVKWTPRYEYNPTYDEETLVFWEEALSFNDDLTFVVEGVPEEVWENVKDECLYLQDDSDIGETLSCDQGTLIKGSSGKIYVGGLFVYKDHSLHFSYDFHPSVLKLNRDRKSVDNWDLKVQTTKLCAKVLPMEELVSLLKMNVPDVSQGDWLLGSDVKEACYEDFIAENEGCVLATYESEKGELQDKYEAKPIIHDSSRFATMVMGSTGYSNYLEEVAKEDYEEDIRTPVDLLDEFESKCYFEEGSKEAKEFREIIDLFIERGVSWDD